MEEGGNNEDHSGKRKRCSSLSVKDKSFWPGCSICITCSQVKVLGSAFEFLCIVGTDEI